MKRFGHQRYLASCLRATLALSAATGLWAAARAEAASLTIGMATAPTAIDPHFHLLATNMSISAHIFEPLVKQDASQRPVPGLATAWRLIDPLTWEFTLRRGVKFQDGSDFTAEDVAFSLKRVPLVPNSPSSFAVYTRSIQSWDIVDPHTIRLRTKTPTPDLPLALSLIAIMSHQSASGEAREGKTTSQLNAGNGTVGTGPYRFTSFAPGDRVVLAKNDQYWGEKEPWDTVTILAQSNGAARVAAALSGQIDLVEKVSGENLEAVQRSSRVALIITPSNSVTYIVLDQGRDASPGLSGTDGRNPLKDPRVRAALSLALNRDGISRLVMTEMAVPAAELAGEGMFGTSADAAPEPFKLEEARRLLASAGWGGGFGLSLATTSGVYVQDTQTAQAIAAMWTRLGVRTTVESTPAPIFYGRRNGGELSAFVTSSSIMTGQASDLLNIYLATPNKEKSLGSVNFSGYSSPKVDALLEAASQEMDPAIRAELLQQATRIAVVEDHAMLPVFVEKIGYAVRRPLVFSPRVDKWITAMQVRDYGTTTGPSR